MRAALLILLLFSATGWSGTATAQESERAFLIKVTPEANRMLTIAASKEGVSTGIPSVDRLHKRHEVVGMERVFAEAGKFEARHREFGLHRWYRLTIDRSEPLDIILSRYAEDRHVERVERIRSRKMLGKRSGGPLARRATVPNDPQFDAQWQYNATSDADIDLVEAWDLSTGSSNVVVAVLDSGADMDHPDLVGNLWVNPGEVPGNGVDDDNNGFVDDVNGWDFSDGDNNPDDTDGHGTHTAGTIAASTHNGTGVSGIAGGFDGGGARVMPLKIFENAVDDIIANAFVYAADNGAVISSNSWGGGDQSTLIENAIDYFIANAGGPGEPMDGGLVVFASGNDGTNDASWGYPASYAPVMGVAASDQSDRIPDWSNYGSWVDISAPGSAILSTVVGGYDSYDGTSMACPHVAGVAALVASYAPGMTAAQVRNVLESSADNIDALNPNRVGQLGSGRLNAFAALSAAVPPDPDHTAPGVISGLSVTGASYSSLQLRWTATGDDGATGRASRYDVRFDTSPISDFDNAPAYSGAPNPQEAGSTEQMTLGGLTSTTTYYVALRAIDEAGNAGPVSAQAVGTTSAGPALTTDPTSLSVSLAAGASSTLELRVLNTGTGSVSFDASVSTRTASSFRPRRIVDPEVRDLKERIRPVQPFAAPIHRLSGGSVLVWDPDFSPNTGEAVRDALGRLGYAVDYTSDLSSVGDLSAYVGVVVTLGMFPDNHVLSRAQGDQLAAYLDGGGGVYMEGGDTWAYDSARSVHGYFELDGLDDGTNDLAQLNGVAGTWTAGARWNYTTDPDQADYVDRLQARQGGLAVLTNQSGGYDAAVATDGGTFRTVGASFAAGLLSQSDLDAFLAGTIDFLTAGQTGAWLSVSPTSGSVGSGGSTTLEVSVDASTLAVGTYNGTITVASTDGQLRVEVPVALVVGDGGGDGGDGDDGDDDDGDDGQDPMPDPIFAFDAHDLLAQDGSRISEWPDATGNGHRAFQGGGRRPTVLTGWIGQAPAVVFDGSNDFLKISNDAAINTLGPYPEKTIALVLETGFDTTEREVAFEQGGGSRGLSIYVMEGELYMAAWNIPSDGGTGGWGPIWVSTPVEPYTLYTVILRFDAAAGTISGRVNGADIGTTAGGGTLNTHSGKVGLGAMWNATRFHDRAMGSTGRYWSGSIAAMQYFNDAITDAQAATIESDWNGAFFGGIASQARKNRDLITDDEELPGTFELSQNYPNPFNPTTSISYTLPADVKVRLQVFDILGRVVTTLVDDRQVAGTHTALWNGRDATGAPVASGTYLYRITAGTHAQARTMLLLK